MCKEVEPCLSVCLGLGLLGQEGALCRCESSECVSSGSLPVWEHSESVSVFVSEGDYVLSVTLFMGMYLGRIV